MEKRIAICLVSGLVGLIGSVYCLLFRDPMPIMWILGLLETLLTAYAFYEMAKAMSIHIYKE